MGEPHRVVGSKAVSAVLEDIQALDDDEIDLLFGVMDAAMHDEWDCSLHNGIEMFGVAEMRVMFRTAAIMANAAETD
jgi:hypothetical protein